MKEYLFNNWKIEKEIGHGRYAVVYLASKDVDGVKAKCAIKHISIPKEGETVEDLVKAGVIKDVDEAKAYYLDVLSDIKKDFMIMEKFKDKSEFLNCYEYVESFKNNNEGLDIYIRMELASDIIHYFEDKDISEEIVLKLGLDITEALKLCEEKKIVHKDIKPSNIFVGENSCFKLGDFGGARTSAFIGKSRKVIGTYSYMSPEVYNKDGVTSSTDVYSLGIVMYQLLNNGLLPFENSDVNSNEALKIRLSGEKIPVIAGVSLDVMNLILKACSFNPEERYSTALEMNDAIRKLIKPTKKKVISSTVDKTVSVYDVDLLEKETINVNEIELIEKASGNKLMNKVITPKNAEKISNNKAYKIYSNMSRKKNKKLKLILILFILLIILLFLFFGFRYIFSDCKHGYVKNNFRCVKGYYYCDDEYTLNDDNKCVKVLESEDASVSYSCGDGYILNGDICIKNDTKDPTSAYRCNAGFTLKNNKCVKDIKQAAKTSYSCSVGYTLQNNKCVKETVKTAKSTYKCDSDYTLSGTTCIKTFYNSGYIKTDYSCNSSCTLSSDKKTCNCTKNPTGFMYYPRCDVGVYDYTSRKCKYTETPKVTYSCKSGEYVNNSCKITNRMNAVVVYSCDNGYLVVENKCVKKETINPQVKYSCDSGMTLKGKECHKTQTVNAVKTYGCDDGYTFTGNSCVLQEEKKATAKYTCSRVYEFNEENKKCEKYEELSPKVHLDEKK